MKTQTLEEFCVSQVMRLGFFEPFRFLSMDALREYRRWLERKCAPDRARGEKLIDRAVELEKLPTIADLNRLWEGLFPATNANINPACPQCGGSGWVEIERGAYTYAARCPANCGIPVIYQAPEDATQRIAAGLTRARI